MPHIDDPNMVECWRCGKQRYTFESCHHCGASCKPLTKEKQKNGYTEKDTEWWASQRED